jgi:hypothetical protein
MIRLTDFSIVPSFFMTHLEDDHMLNYGIKLDDDVGGTRPKDMWLRINCLPDSKEKPMLRLLGRTFSSSE